MHPAAKKMRLSEPTTKIWMTIDPYYTQRKCRPMSLVSGNIRFLQIFAGVLRRGVSNDSGVIENIDFQGFWTLCLRHLSKIMRPKLLYSIIQSHHVAFPLTPKYMTLSDPDWLFLAKFCFCASFAGWHRATSENNCVKMNEDRHILSPVKIFGMDSSFWQYKVCADIQLGSLERRR